MKQITVHYGPEHLTGQVPSGYTVADLREDDKFRTGLGYGDNITILINGVSQGDQTVIPADAAVKIETAANEKQS